MPAFYKEKQKFSQPWLWILIIASTVPAVGFLTYGLIKQLAFGIPWGDEPMSDTGLMLTTLFIWAVCGGVVWMLLASELHLEVRDKAVFYKFPVFSPGLKRIGMETLESWEIIKFSPFEYGGYGVRKTLKKGTAFIVKGKNGLELKERKGKTILIGTQRPEELKAAMQREWDRFNEG